MNKDEERFNQLVRTITNGYKAIDEIKYVISQELCEFERSYKNQSKFLTAKKSTPTFQHFLVEYLAKTYSQVIPVLRVGRYVKEQGISIWNLSGIPINKMELIALSKVKWTDDVFHNVKTKGFLDIMKTYLPEKYKKYVKKKDKETES